MSIQLTVFTDEQGIPRETCLEDNEHALHVLLFSGDQAVATARLLQLGEGRGEIARVAVVSDKRGRGLGQLLVGELEEWAAELNIAEVELHPHHYLENFYSRMGYQATGRIDEPVGGHDLIVMSKKLATAESG